MRKPGLYERGDMLAVTTADFGREGVPGLASGASYLLPYHMGLYYGFLRE